jgi:hypothetical protein
VRDVHLPDWNGTAKMFTPKPQAEGCRVVRRRQVSAVRKP